MTQGFYGAELDELTQAGSRAGRFVDYSVAFNLLAAAGALVAAIAPAIMANADRVEMTAADGIDEVVIRLRGSVSDYWDVDPRIAFWLPFTIAGILLIVDGVLSTVARNRERFGRRYQNIVLGVALLALTWFNLDDSPTIHYIAATVFFVLFALVMAYASLLGITGRVIDGFEEATNRQAERVNGTVSLVFLLLLGVALIFWQLDWINFYYFEVYALVSFALHYVVSGANPFPYNRYEFPNDTVNGLLRAVGIMAPRPTPLGR